MKDNNDESISDINTSSDEEVEELKKEPIGDEKTLQEATENILDEEVDEEGIVITKKEFLKFVGNKASGDAEEISKVSGLAIERVEYITENYPEIKRKYTSVAKKIDVKRGPRGGKGRRGKRLLKKK